MMDTISRRATERGYAIAYYAAFLAFVVVPLAVLSIDIPRALYVRTHLQAASDAACEAAVQALDVPLFNQRGQKSIDLARARGYAASAFQSTVADSPVVRYSPSLTSLRLLSPTVAACSASAALVPFLPTSPDLQVVVHSVSEARVERR